MKIKDEPLELPWPPQVLNPNVKRHWAIKNLAFQEYKGQCKDLAFMHEPMLKFSIEFIPPNKRKRDRDNLISSSKALQDGLAAAWEVDDSEFQITYKPYTHEKTHKYGKVIIERLK